MPNLCCACTRLSPSAIWQQCNLSLGIQITPKWGVQWSPKQMVIYMGHWKHGRIRLLNGSLLGPCQALARLVSRTALAYFAKPPCSGCQRGAGTATEEEQLLQSHQSYCKWWAIFLRPAAGKGHGWASKAHLQTPSRLLTCRRCCKLFVFNRLVSEMKGKLQIHPEDNVKGQAGISCKRSTCYILREC